MLTQPIIFPETIHTVIALIFAHVVADFLLQNDWMVQNKRKPWVLLLHIAIVFAVSVAALGGAWKLAGFIAATHLAIDGLKLMLSRDEDTLEKGRPLTLFCADQLAHIAVIFLAATAMPQAVTLGIWGNWVVGTAPPLVTLVIYLTGFIITVAVGGFLVGMVLAPYADDVKKEAEKSKDPAPTGLPDAGKVIGQLERAMVFLLILIGQPMGIGFLIAAKSFLRFEASKQQSAAEYVIIGTLMSFGWALVVASGTVALGDYLAR